MVSAQPSSTAAVIVVSTTAATDRSQDSTGMRIHTWLTEYGFEVPSVIYVADGQPVADAIRQQCNQGRQVIITTGGTGVSPDDLTPEMTEPLLDIEIPGLMEQLRRIGQQHTPYAILTRGVAGFSGSTFIMNLPGSRGGVEDGLTLLDSVITHLLEQRSHGGGHAPRHTNVTSEGGRSGQHTGG